MANFGWSLPPGCGMLPGEEMLPPCCEECPEDVYENCPGEDKCEMFQKLVKDEADVDQQMYDDYLEIEGIAKATGYTPIIGVQEPPDDPRIFNRKQKDGTYRPISEFFDVSEADVNQSMYDDYISHNVKEATE